MLPINASQRSIGNLECEALFERWLERIRLGKIAYVSIIAAESPIHSTIDSAGAPSCMVQAYYSADLLKMQVMAKLNVHVEEPRKIEESADRICYNVSKGPACFDFHCWLVIAEMTRRRSGAPGPLKVGFAMTVDSPEERAIHKSLRVGMYENVIFPSLAFVGAVKDDSCVTARENEQYTINTIVDWAKAGEEVPLFKPDAESIKAVQEYLGDGPAPVTITLREADYWQYRNSDLTQWLKVAEYLEKQGERVIFIRDTAKAFEEITGFEICPSASTDIGVRLALYEAAKCNLFVSNGPFMLGLFGSKPWLMFLETSQMSPFVPETKQWWRQYHGIDPDTEDRFPWSKPTQKIVWKRDRYENIIEAWEEMWPIIESMPLAEAAE